MHGAALVGRFVDETAPPAFRADALSRYREVAQTGQPNFGAMLLREGIGPLVSYERLLLPFTASGSTVDYICCIVTMVTQDNGFSLDIALKGQICGPSAIAEMTLPSAAA